MVGLGIFPKRFHVLISKWLRISSPLSKDGSIVNTLYTFTHQQRIYSALRWLIRLINSPMSLLAAPFILSSRSPVKESRQSKCLLPERQRQWWPNSGRNVRIRADRQNITVVLYSDHTRHIVMRALLSCKRCVAKCAIWQFSWKHLTRKRI